jgi:hypothetical protein
MPDDVRAGIINASIFMTEGIHYKKGLNTFKG